MRWLCVHLPNLPLEALAPPEGNCVAVVERQRTRRILIACSKSCAAFGIEAGQDATVSLIRYPELSLLERSRRRELHALRALAVWSEQFSAFASIEPDRLALWLEIGTVLDYFGGIDALLGRVQSGLAALGYQSLIGIAPTPEAALAAAINHFPAIYDAGLDAALARFPVVALPIREDWRTALADFGLRRLGEVFALPTDALARRLGPELVAYLNRLRGIDPHPMQPYKRPERFRRKFECFGAIESFEGVLFPLKRILVELEGFLRGRDAALQRLEILFGHERHPDSRLEVCSTLATRDAARLFLLVRERLERATLAAAVESITVSVPRLIPMADAQRELLEGGARRDDAWGELLDRLRARLGANAVTRLGLRADHRPERAWCVLGAEEIRAGKSAPVDPPPDPRRERPLWLFPARLLDDLPIRVGTPERIESGWWDGHEARRDYYIATLQDGSLGWLYRDAEDDRWYLQGLWA